MKKLVAACLVLAIPPLAQAAAVTVTDVGQWLENRSTNTIGRTPGVTQQIDVPSAVPNGLNGTTATATQGNVTVPLPYVGSTTFPNEFATALPANPSLYGAWQLNFLNGGDITTAVTPAISATLLPMPFANNVRVTNVTSTSFSWNIPGAASVDAVRVNIYDHGRLNLAGTNVDLVFNRTFAPTTNSFNVPSLLSNNLPLINGNLYTLEISLIDFASNNVNSSQNDLRNRSRLFVDFTPGVTPGSGAFLPVVEPGVGGAPPLFHFDIAGVGSNLIFIDPAVAAGYSYAIGAGNPNFASVLLPTGIGDNLYQVVLADGTRVDVTGGVSYTFAPGGVSSFKVLGIEPSANLDTADPTAFMTGLTFAGSGNFTGTMQAIPVPEPAVYAMWIAGLAGLGLSRRRRR